MSLIARLAWRQTRAQWRRSDWRSLLLALLITTTLVSLLTLTSERLFNTLSRQGAEVMGTDLLLSSSRPIPEQRLEQARQANVASAQAQQFVSMAETDELSVLSTIRAVTDGYPLRGSFVTEPPLSQPQLPAPGKVWAEGTLLERLNIQVGDTIYLGESELIVARELISGPGRSSGFTSFNPQVIMRADELAATGVISPGSRVTYQLLAAGEPTAIAELEQAWRSDKQSWQRIFAATSERPLDGNALASASHYLKLSAVFALLLGAIAILLSLRRYSSDQRTRSALLLSMGMTPRQLLKINALQLVFGWALAAIPGAVIGLLMHQWIMAQLSELLPFLTPVNLWLLISSPLLALSMLLIIGLPTLLPLGRTSILTLLRSDQPLGQSIWQYALYGALLMLVIGIYMGSLVAAVLLSLALLVLGGIAGFITQHVISFLARSVLGKQPLAPLLKLRLRQQRHWHRLQAGVFSLLLAILAALLLSRNSLIDQWQAQLPTDTPNHFAINIQPQQQPEFAAWIDSNQLDAQLYPMIRGRIVERNGLPVNQAFNAVQLQEHALHRELNLTWQAALSSQTQVVEGSWEPSVPGISLEQELALDLGLSLGEKLTFNIGSTKIEAQITSIRSVDWESFQPNFYVIFTPGLLDGLPTTYMTSFKLPEEQKSLAKGLTRQFPGTTLIDIDQILRQAQQILARLSDSATLIMALTLAAGLVMLFNTLKQELAQRRFESALLMTLGASEKQTQGLDQLEFTLMGICCGLTGSAIAELLLAALNGALLELPITLHPWMWLSLPLAAALGFTLIGRWVRGRMSLSDSYWELKTR